MKRILALGTLLTVSVFVLNGVITQASNQDSFFTEAAQMGLAEVQLSQLALERATSEQVKTFAQQMVTDHTAANQELTALAASKSVTVPTDTDAKHKAAATKLGGMSGTDFDKAYMKQMVKDHEAAVKLFQRQADRSDDADVKAFAAKTLPTLQNHLQMARTLNDSVKNTRTSGGNSDTNSNSDMNMNSNSGNMNTNSNRKSKRNSNSNSNSNVNR